MCGCTNEQMLKIMSCIYIYITRSPFDIVKIDEQEKAVRFKHFFLSFQVHVQESLSEKRRQSTKRDQEQRSQPNSSENLKMNLRLINICLRADDNSLHVN
jgi:hypothetical protein